MTPFDIYKEREKLVAVLVKDLKKSGYIGIKLSNNLICNLDKCQYQLLWEVCEYRNDMLV